MLYKNITCGDKRLIYRETEEVGGTYDKSQEMIEAKLHMGNIEHIWLM